MGVLSKVRMIEPVHIPDTYISGIGDVQEVARGLYRFTFYAKHIDPFTGQHENVVVAKNICALEDVAPALLVCANAIGWHLGGEIAAIKRAAEKH